jgi:predicted NBD/HSP70 family sugar kinase
LPSRESWHRLKVAVAPAYRLLRAGAGRLAHGSANWRDSGTWRDGRLPARTVAAWHGVPVVNLAGSAKLLRAMNSSAALSLLFERGRLTRGELREATGLSKPTVSEALRRLVEADLAVPVGFVHGGPGPNAEIYAVNPDVAHVASVSVREGADGPWLAAAWCDLTGTIRGQIETPAELRRRDPVTVVSSAMKALLPGGSDRLARVQLGVAGSFDPATRTVHHVDLAGFDTPGLVDKLEQVLGAPVGVDNDVNLATVAERRRGSGAGTDGFVLMWLGEGLGLGIDLGGTLLRGSRGGAGEIGYIPLGSGRADLQQLIGGAAVRALAAEHGHAGATTAAAAANAVRDRHFLNAYAGRVAVGLATVVAVLDPALVVLAGPVAAAGGIALRDAVSTALAKVAPFDTTVEVTTVEGDPVVLGGLDAGLAFVRERLIERLGQPTANASA